MPSVKEVRERIEALTRRLRAKAEKIAEVEPKARAAVVQNEGKLNGKVPELVGLRFEHDALADEIRRLEEQELPSAQSASEAAQRARALSLAHRIHRNRSATAAKLDEALATAERCFADLVRSQVEKYGIAMAEAGHRQAAPHWSNLAARAVWKQAPNLAEHLGLSVALRHHGSPMAGMLVGPPAEPDPLALPGDASVAENKLVPVGSRTTAVINGARRMATALLGPREGYRPAGPDADRVAAKARKRAEEDERKKLILAALDRGEDVSAMLLPAPAPVPRGVPENKRVPVRGDVAVVGRTDSTLAAAEERRAAKARKREALARQQLDTAMPVKDLNHVTPGAA